LGKRQNRASKVSDQKHLAPVAAQLDKTREKQKRLYDLIAPIGTAFLFDKIYALYKSSAADEKTAANPCIKKGFPPKKNLDILLRPFCCCK
jgi:hypothetical protein